MCHQPKIKTSTCIQISGDVIILPWALCALLLLLPQQRAQKEEEGETRVLLQLHEDIAPFKFAVLPLMKKA